MKMNHNVVVRICVLISLSCFLLMISGCSINWVSEVQGMIPAVAGAASAFIALLIAFGAKVSPALLQKVNDWEGQLQKDLATLSDLVTQYDNAQPGTGKDSLMAEIESVAGIVVQNFTAILPELHIDNPATQAKITAIANAILIQLQAIAALIPAVKGQTTIQKVANAGNLALSGHQFVTSFNQVLKHGTGDAETDAAVASVAPLPTPVGKA